MTCHLTYYTFSFASTKQNTTTNSLLINSFIKCSYNQHSTKRTKTIAMTTMMTVMYNYNQLTLEQFFYQVLIQSTFNEKNKHNSNDDNDDNHVQDVLASNQHHFLVPKGMNCTPRYQVDYANA